MFRVAELFMRKWPDLLQVLGDGKAEAHSLGLFAIDPGSPVMPFRNLFDNGQSQTRSFNPF
jgi:hypothetical protein